MVAIIQFFCDQPGCTARVGVGAERTLVTALFNKRWGYLFNRGWRRSMVKPTPDDDPSYKSAPRHWCPEHNTIQKRRAS